MDCPMVPPYDSVLHIDEIKWIGLGMKGVVIIAAACTQMYLWIRSKKVLRLYLQISLIKTYIKFGPGGQSKFYFGHLSEEQMHEFTRMLNNGEVKIAYPGHFYVVPFFIQKIAKDKVA